MFVHASARTLELLERNEEARGCRPSEANEYTCTNECPVVSVLDPFDLVSNALEYGICVFFIMGDMAGPLVFVLTYL